MTNLSFVLSKLRNTSSPNLCLVSCNTGRCDSAAFLKNNWQRGIKFHEQETIWETEIMPIFLWGSKRGPVILPIALSPPKPPPPTTSLPKSPKVKFISKSINLQSQLAWPLRRHVFPTFFYQTTIGIYDTGQNGRSRTNIYFFLNCRRNITLHIHKCPEKASTCQVPGCKRIVKKEGHECPFQASKHLSFCTPIRKNQTTARNNILQGKLPFHQPKNQ